MAHRQRTSRAHDRTSPYSKAGADTETRNSFDATGTLHGILSWICRTSFCSLISHGADLKRRVQRHRGVSSLDEVSSGAPLHVASFTARKYPRLEGSYWKHGANPNAPDNWGSTALHTAIILWKVCGRRVTPRVWCECGCPKQVGMDPVARGSIVPCKPSNCGGLTGSWRRSACPDQMVARHLSSWPTNLPDGNRRQIKHRSYDC